MSAPQHELHEKEKTDSVSSNIVESGKVEGDLQPSGQQLSLVHGHELHRGLKSRHVSMLAIGGALGTGLIIGTGNALSRTGPGPLLWSYTFVGFLVWIVMCSLGEMAAYLPVPEGFPGFATRFVDPAFGFAVGYTYWCKYLLITPGQLTSCALVLQYWVGRDQVNPGVWIAVFLVVIICINLFGVKFFGEMEFWLSSLKVAAIVGVMIVSLVIACGGGPRGEATGFRYWRDPGGIKPFWATGDFGNFLAFIAALINAVFAYSGIELVGVTVGEAQNPRRTVPRAIKLTFWRILAFYIINVFLLGLILPYNSPILTASLRATTGASASPFVVAIQEAGIRTLPAVLNGAIFVFVFSAANSDLYIATRTIYSLSSQGRAPKFFSKTNKTGVPYYALGVSSAFALLGFLNVAENSRVVFGYFVNALSVFGLIAWCSILTCHIFFRRALAAQGIPVSSLPYSSPLGVYGTYFSLFFCIIVCLIKNFDAWRGGDGFDERAFVTGYIGIPVFFIFYIGAKLYLKSSIVKPHEADLVSGKAEIDREEKEFLERQELKKQMESANMSRGRWFYKTFIAWLF